MERLDVFEFLNHSHVALPKVDKKELHHSKEHGAFDELLLHPQSGLAANVSNDSS
jgi:hypothetical protein